MVVVVADICCFFFNDTATTEIYTLSLHDALPIFPRARSNSLTAKCWSISARRPRKDRKSTRLNSSLGYISYAVFCLKKKQMRQTQPSLHARQEHNIKINTEQQDR